MARVPYVSREDLDAEGKEIYDRIRGDRNIPEVELQVQVLMHNPLAAGYLTSLGARLRFHSAMPNNLKELTIILVAREWDSDLEWAGHSPLAAEAGVSEASIESVRTCRDGEELTGQEAIIARFVHEMVQNKLVSDETFNAAQGLLGDHGVVDLSLTVGYYSAISLAQIALKPELEPGTVSTL